MGRHADTFMSPWEQNSDSSQPSACSNHDKQPLSELDRSESETRGVQARTALNRHKNWQDKNLTKM